jgi:hypothetical protein
LAPVSALVVPPPALQALAASTPAATRAMAQVPLVRRTLRAVGLLWDPDTWTSEMNTDHLLTSWHILSHDLGNVKGRQGARPGHGTGDQR